MSCSIVTNSHYSLCALTILTATTFVTIAATLARAVGKGKIAPGLEHKPMNANDRTELLQLLARESYFERELTLASGRASNFYIDCKRTLYLPRGAHLAGELMLALVMAEGVTQIGGMAAGALPVTDAIISAAHRRGYDLTGFFVRKETKPHGLQQQIEGAFKKDRSTAVIDDTITTGGSSLQAVAAMRAAGATVGVAFALVERGEGAAEAFAREDLRYVYLFTAEEVRAARAAGV
jgi:orotate phosphoribosyltransferase